MKYRCRIGFDLNELPAPGDVRVTTEQNIRDTVRVIVAEMLTAEKLEPASPVTVTITERKAVADLKVWGTPGRPLTFIETMEGIDQ